MISIRKPPQAPPILEREGASETSSLCIRYENGERRFTFKRSLYAHLTVLDALIQAQHGKCCFCEVKIFSDGDVEHFRPKAMYYWLAYAWPNLFLSCSACNSRHKRGKFPLDSEANRMQCHLETNRESPVFLDPSRDRPEDHIEWRQEVPVPLSERGRVTIKELALDRRAILDLRLEHLSKIRALLRVHLLLATRKANAEIQLEVEQLLQTSAQPDAPFSAATRALLLAQDFPL